LLLAAASAAPASLAATPATPAAPAPAPAAPPAATVAPLKNPEFLSQFAATNRFRLGQPGGITVTPQGDAVLFLRAAGPRSFTQDLWLFDVATGQERVLLTAEQVLAGEEEKLTAEELARRERQRVSSRGIVSFQLDDSGNTLLVPLSGRLFIVDITDRSSPKKRELKAVDAAGSAFPIDPRFSPDASKVASVRNDELYVFDLATNTQTRITTGAGNGISHGTAEFVAQEEMSRSRGYWFSPDSQRILYQRTDTSPLEVFTIADPANPARPAQTWPYPRAGKANAIVSLHVASIANPAAPHVRVQWDSDKHPYLARVQWPKHGPLTILVQNRRQTEQVLLAVDPDSGQTRPLLTETDPAWINLEGDFPKWLPDGSGFLWMTEQIQPATEPEITLNGVASEPPTDGWRLELRGSDGSLKHTLVAGDQALNDFVGFAPSTDPRGAGFQPAADDKPINPTHVIVSRSPGAVGNNLWLVPMRSREAPRSITEPRASSAPSAPGEERPTNHGAILSRRSEVWVHTTIGPAGEPRWFVRRGFDVAAQPVGELRSIAEQPPFTPAPILTRVLIDAARLPDGTVSPRVPLNAVVIRPRDFVPGRKYPVLNAVYGGPTTTVVNAAPRSYLLHQWLADQGFIVVALDNRGTPGRGRAFERLVNNDLMAIPLSDQARGTLLLAQQFPEMDTARIGMYGWSYGGYFAAMAAMRRPEVFKAAVAGAPVADWADYDTHYTERYMGLPQENVDGYARNNVLTYAKDLRVPLLIIHGTADDNVYLTHALKMADALFRAGKDFEFLPLSGFTHMVTEPAAVEQMWSRVARFFREHLRAE
jgi:dipeptidyl-peptidase-4